MHPITAIAKLSYVLKCGAFMLLPVLPAAAAPVRGDSPAAQLVTEYIDAVGRKDFARVTSLLHSDVVFSTPGAQDIHGAPAYAAALRRLAPVLVRNETKRVFDDGEEVCIVYDFVTDTAAGAIPSVEWVRVRDGKIAAVRLIFHTQPWPAVVQELKARAAHASEQRP